jgi:hypothetical protein
MQKLRIVTLGSARGPWTMDKPRTRTSYVKALGMGYHRVEGNRRASRDGPVSDLPPEIPTSRFATFASLSGRRASREGLPTAIKQLRIVILGFGTS